MASIKQLIINAIIKVSQEDPALDREGGPTAEEARDSFIALLMAELFPEHGTESAVVVPVVESPAASPAKKLTKEEKEAAKAAKAAEKEAAAKAKEEAKAAKEAEKAAKAEAKVAKAASPKKSPEEKEAEKAAKAAEKEAAKAAAAKAKEEAKAAEKAEKEAAKLAEKAAKLAEKEAAKAAKASPKAADVAVPASPAPKPKKAKAEKPADGSNLQKIDPTWRKALKEADKENAKELEPELLTYLNALSNAGFNSRTAREHVATFLAERTRPTSESTAQVAPVDLEVVEFEGKEYYVNPETKRVYEGVVNEEGELTITKPVGYVGMADFKDMVLEEE